MRSHFSRAYSITCVVTLAGLLAACSGQKDGAPPPGAGMPPPEVSIVTLAPQTVTLSRELPGRTVPYLVAEVRPQATGIVKERLFVEGALVKAGQPLYQLDDALYRAEAASARAALARAEATLNTATLNAKRSVELLKIEAVSKQDDENAQAARQQAEADVAAARAVLDRAQINLAYARIASPISGRIGKSSVTPGALLTANQEAALATVQQLDPMYVDVTQSSSELLELRRQLASGRMKAANIPVEIVLEDGSRHAHKGKLAFSETTVDPATGSYTLRIVVPNPDQVLLPGIYIRAVVGSGTRENAILAPQRAVTRDPKGNAFAMVLDAGGLAQVRPLKASQTVGDQWLVEEGLAAGERVIVEGLQKIRPGMPAKVAQPPAPAATPAAAPPPAAKK
ncbi:MAG: efflux RND transporter periplasmic adaptor subunit [Lysobacter sp.]|nr:efflux RND transporter periplasmic adaptor subunit [Lysobacter sp.]